MEIELYVAPGHTRWPSKQSSYPAPLAEIAARAQRIYLEYGVRVLAATVRLRRAEREKAHITHFVRVDRSICPTVRETRVGDVTPMRRAQPRRLVWAGCSLPCPTRDRSSPPPARPKRGREARRTGQRRCRREWGKVIAPCRRRSAAPPCRGHGHCSESLATTVR